MKSKQILTLILLTLLATSMHSQDSNFHIYLCFGQSNMEGSATIEEQDKVSVDRFMVMSTVDCDKNNREIGEWYAAIPPLSQCNVGLSPADYFGRTLAAKLPDDILVGVVSVAIGGCDIRLFDKDIYKGYVETYPEKWFTDKVAGYGGNPYQRLITCAQKAQKKGVIKGIILHQGETNTGDSEWPLYVKRVYDNMLKDLSLNVKDVPLLAGEVVHEEQGGKCASMNTIINKLPQTIPTSYVVSSKGCEVKPDSVHFNSAGVRELGKRYANMMFEKIYKNKQ